MNKKKTKLTDYKSISNFLFEVGVLSKTPRSGFHFLGTGEQSVAEHVNRTVFVGYALSMLDGKVDSAKVMKMCLLHDISEARISDLNYVHQKYVDKREHEAINDIAASVPFGEDMKATINEYEERESREAIFAKEADVVEWIISLKEQVDTGNKRALEWIKNAQGRLKTEIGKELVKSILTTDSIDWWYDKESSWWVNRNKK